MSFEIIISHKGESRTLEESKPELTVGRSTPAEEVDVDLSPDKRVSRKHFVIKLEYNMGSAKNEAWVKDLGSSRGTQVNGESITDPVMVTHEDTITAGDSELCVRIKRDRKQKEKSKMSFQEKVAERSKGFGGPDDKPKSKPSRPQPKPKEEDVPPPPPPAEEEPTPVVASSDEMAPGLMAALTAGAHQTECAGFVAYSIEDLATAANRYARENKMHAISASVVQEGKGSSACFRAMVVFHNPNTS